MRLLFALALPLALRLMMVPSVVRVAQPPPTEAKPLTAEQKARLKERDHLATEAARFDRAGKVADMLAAWEQKLAIEREVYGEVHEQVAASVTVLAQIHEVREDFAAARKARQE